MQKTSVNMKGINSIANIETSRHCQFVIGNWYDGKGSIEMVLNGYYRQY